jgi:hypothetical protein
MLEDVITNPEEMGIMVETAVYKHIAAFYYITNARVKYRENSQVKETDAIIELTNDEKAKVQGSLIITKRAEDYGITSHKTRIPVVRIPAFAFLYLLGNAENEGYAANM